MATKHRVTVLPGDGIGPEITSAMQRVLEAAHAPILWDEYALSVGDELNPSALASIDLNRVAIKGPTGTPSGEGHRSFNVRLREAFSLYANVRPAFTIPGIVTPFSDRSIDMVIFRENLEDLYIGQERTTCKGYEAVSRITTEGSQRIARFAKEYMRSHGRKKAVVGAKDNILKLTHGHFRSVVEEVFADDSDVVLTHMIPDALACAMVRWPESFDSIILPNFAGDILSDLAAGLVGGLGIAPGANYGDRHVVFEAVHGTAPDIAGKGIANPTAIILSASMMLEHLGEAEVAKRIKAALFRVYRDGAAVTGDINQKVAASTAQFTDAVIAAL